jgi:hypothetical protein
MKKGRWKVRGLLIVTIDDRSFQPSAPKKRFDHLPDMVLGRGVVHSRNRRQVSVGGSHCSAAS